MLKNIVISIVLFLPFVINAQRVRETMDHGNSDITWRIYETDGTVSAFTVTLTQMWYALPNTVKAYDLKTNQKREYPKLGTVPSAGIKTIVSDNRGSVWFGGNEGVTVYKNGTFKSFTKADGLSSNKVNKVFYTSGSVWVGTENGVSLYKNGVWSVYGVEDGLPGKKVRDITADNAGGVWFATNKGVARLKGSQWKKYDAKSGLSWNDAKAIAFDTRKGELWVAVGEQDVNSYKGKEWSVFMDILVGITSIMVDTQSRIWFGSMGGILKYNGFEWITDPSKIGFPAAQINDMFRDHKGDLFFALETGILHMKNPYPY